MINSSPGTAYNPEAVQSALRIAIEQFQQQTLALSSSSTSAIASDPTSPTGIPTGPGYYRHSRHSSLAVPQSTRRRKVIAFDLYGTLLSTDSIAHELAKHYGEEAAPGIATLWRRFQLEYTWRITSMGEFKNFQEITRSALGHALMEHSGIKLTAKAASELMRAYDSLHVYPDVEAGLKLLKDAKEGKTLEEVTEEGEGEGEYTTRKEVPSPQSLDVRDSTGRSSSRSSASSSSSSSLPEMDAYIFTNGTPEMAMRSMVTSPELSHHTKASERGLFSDPGSIVSADSVQCYKPDPRVYQHLLDVAGVRTEQDKRNVWVISANPFDVVGAKAAGLRAAWIDRAGKGWVDRLDEMRVPSVTATGVDEAIKAILSWN
ncbi:uncharacterized protein B0I36DRAFT_335327 [Microdochium trichocladiopsis]|uniref:HAD-like domain-containing protein n=1 Tax=Microdochium trichocladiopsis TaxID=1682393 RepID=A0A9P8XVI7_9PEZI|nr:uncharacterized protein B0I36DRAFT_335327 [Microdochium trichocladiopsis]KAH7018111.1 hypothetical protein B0I36DRAFT_335327 [Microdochium trichocladiopsis]